MSKKRDKSSKRKAVLRFRISAVWLLPVLFVFSFLLYFNTLGHEFVIDDTTLIAQNPQITELRWGEILGRSGYRPVRTLTYAINYALGGLDPFGYHLVNVVLHGLNVVLAYLLFLKLSGSVMASFAGGLLLAAHPVQTAAVAYVSGRKDLLATFFLVSGSLLYLRFKDRKKSRWLLTAMGLFLLGVLSKEVAIVFPVLLVLLDLHLETSSVKQSAGKPQAALWTWVVRLRKSTGKALWFYLACVALAFVALYYSLYIARASRMEGLWGGTLERHIGTSFKLFAHYVRLVLFPHPLVADYTGQVFEVSEGILEPSTLVAVGLLAAFVVTASLLFSRRPLLSFGMFWFFIALAPVLQLVPFHEIAADHFLYLPMIGAAVVVVAAVNYLAREKGLEVLTLGLVFILCFVCSVFTVSRNRDWASPRTLWEATYEVAPGSYRANTNLGLLYYAQGEWDKAVRLTERAIELNPRGSLPYANLGAFLRERGFQASVDGDSKAALRYETRALEYLLEAVRLEPSNPFNHSNLGDVYKDLALLAQQDWDAGAVRQWRAKALASYRRAIRIGSENPRFPLVYFKFGSTLVDSGDCRGALPYLVEAADRLQDRYDVLQLAGYCCFVENDLERSAQYMERALRVWPNSVRVRAQLESAFLMLGGIYEELDRPPDVIRVFRAMLRIFPDSLAAHRSLGMAYRRTGRTADSIRHLERVLEIVPDGPEAEEIRALLQQLQRTVIR